MTLDEAHHLLFVGSRSPAKIIMISTLSGTETSELNIPGSADDMFYDGTNGCLFVSSEDRYITAVKEDGATSFHLVQSIQRYSGARTSLLDAKLGLHFLAIPESQGASARIIVYHIGN